MSDLLTTVAAVVDAMTEAELEAIVEEEYALPGSAGRARFNLADALLRFKRETKRSEDRAVNDEQA